MARTANKQIPDRSAAKPRAMAEPAPRRPTDGKNAARKSAQAAFSAQPLPQRLAQTLEVLRAAGSADDRAGMARFGIPSERAFGVRMGQIQALAKRLGRDRALAAALWDSGWHEARLLAAYLDDPASLSSAQMDRWAREFDNWALCDTVCSNLFEPSPWAWRKIAQWAPRRDEFVRRAAFALLAAKAVHDKAAGDEAFLRGLVLVEAQAGDGRNFVKKAVNWALRQIGKRNPALRQAALAVAQRLAQSADAAPRWIGKDALRELGSETVARRVAGKG
ncbi:DNA alkylation repair protein [Lysobacter firmicutimachus]|uniref:DNA alkylation repair protein n=1 Tax=Lysobacter firmicutimachus TaxID=1792846 RepID=A0ABU8D7Z1_9GAMM